MKDPLTMQDEQALRAEREFERLVKVKHVQAHRVRLDDEQAACLADWQQRNPPKPRRRTEWRDVRSLVGGVLILAACAGALYAFVEWQALGGVFH